MSALPPEALIEHLRHLEVERLSALKQWPYDYHEDDRGVLLSDRIRKYSEEFDLISPFDPEFLRPAGYDLRVGSNYSIRGERKALNEGMSFEIAPYQVAIIEIFETLNLPRFLVGRWNIRVKHAYQGLLWVGGAQVDPGFRGRLCCPIYNLSTKPVRLKFKEELAMMDFVTTTSFKGGCNEFDWRNRKMLVFDEYGALSSGIEERVQSFQEEINQSRSETTKSITDNNLKTDRSFHEVQQRIDTFIVLIFTVVAVLFAGLGVVAAKSSESSLVSASVSLVSIAAIALYFALRPYYLAAKLAKSTSLEGNDRAASDEATGQLRALLRVGRMEIAFAMVLVLASIGIDMWSVYRVRGSVIASEDAKTLGTQAIRKTQEYKVEQDQKSSDLQRQYDSKIGDLERKIEELRKTKRDK